MACTIRLAADDAKMGQPEAKLGLIPGYGGTQRLPRLVGRSAALKLLLTGETIDAHEALRIGLVDEVVPAVDLMRRAEALALSIAANAPLAVSATLMRSTNCSNGAPISPCSAKPSVLASSSEPPTRRKARVPFWKSGHRCGRVSSGTELGYVSTKIGCLVCRPLSASRQGRQLRGQ